jgi:hypothetical protein
MNNIQVFILQYFKKGAGHIREDSLFVSESRCPRKFLKLSFYSTEKTSLALKFSHNCLVQ